MDGARRCASAAATIAILAALASPAQAASPERIRDLIQQGLQTPAPAPHIIYDCILDDVIEGELIRPEVLSPPPAPRDWLEPPSDFEEALHDDATDLH